MQQEKQGKIFSQGNNRTNKHKYPVKKCDTYSHGGVVSWEAVWKGIFKNKESYKGS